MALCTSLSSRLASLIAMSIPLLLSDQNQSVESKLEPRSESESGSNGAGSSFSENMSLSESVSAQYGFGLGL